jgi:hypothetical protein
MATPKKVAPVEGAAVDLGDAGVRLYRDKSGGKLGGGPTEGQHYRQTVADNARQSVEDFHSPKGAA